MHAGPAPYNLGTLFVSDQQPSSTGIPERSPHCNESSCYGLVWVFFNNVTSLGSWGTISDIALSEMDKNIICLQLGYSEAGPHLPNTYSKPSVNESVPVWLHFDAPCDKMYSNIMQCRPILCEPGKCTHENDLDIMCSEWL